MPGDTPIEFDREFEPTYDTLEEVSPLVRRVVAQNPGPFTFRGTGTYVVGRGTVAVIDPGPDKVEHLDALCDSLRGETIAAILITHTHRDHSPGAALLKERTGATVYAYSAHPPDPYALDEDPEEEKVATEEPFDSQFAPDVCLGDGDAATGPGWTLRAVHTPGHIANHLCFAFDEQSTFFPGDHVMRWSTTVVSPPLGDMAAYKASLRKVIDRPEKIWWPTHGPAARDASAYVAFLLAHREDREQQVRACLADGVVTVPEIVTRCYVGLDEKLRKAAGRSVLSHLLELRDRGAVRCEGRLGAQGAWLPSGA